MNIEQIMKPYFDKKEAFEGQNKINDSYLEQKGILELRLQRIKENKESEINEYLDKTNFVGYEAVRKDLEQEYIKAEQNLEKQIQDLENERQQRLSEIDKFYRVDLREMVEVKSEVRKSLISAQKELKSQLEEVSLNFNSIMLRLSNFKYVYDENHIVQNGEEYKRLFDESHTLIDSKKSIEKQLEQISEYISLTELNSKEIETLMRSMTPVEKEEYDRRKGLNVVEQQSVVDENLTLEELTQNAIDLDPTIEPIMEVNEIDNDIQEDSNYKNFKQYFSEQQEIEEELDSEEIEQQEIENSTNDDLSFEETENNLVEEEQVMDVNLVTERANELIGDIYREIVGYAKKLRQVNINGNEQIQTGMYFKESDLNKAVKNYYRQNKGGIYRIEGLNKEFTITRDSIKTLKEALKKASAVKLVRDKKLGTYDLKRVFARNRVDDIEAEAKMPEEIMTDKEIITPMPTGWYINGNDFIKNLPLLLEARRESWIEKIVGKIKNKKQERHATYDYGFDAETETFDDEMLDYEENVKTR